ncbi:MAG: hypothetical protein EP330_27530 [Deltaproteobacteria bacterium]|nr:MAG: hypothetical protein EP330_27530 [Deltaproteobacteria bacterium]
MRQLLIALVAATLGSQVCEAHEPTWRAAATFGGGLARLTGTTPMNDHGGLGFFPTLGLGVHGPSTGRDSVRVSPVGMLHFDTLGSIRIPDDRPGRTATYQQRISLTPAARLTLGSGPWSGVAQAGVSFAWVTREVMISHEEYVGRRAWRRGGLDIAPRISLGVARRADHLTGGLAVEAYHGLRIGAQRLALVAEFSR